MFKVNNYLPEDIKNFLQEVVKGTQGYDVYLGGGYLRDIWWNLNYTVSTDSCTVGILKEPKDLDIFFIPKTGTEILELPTIPKTYINYDILAVDIPNVRENVHRVRGLFNSKLSTRDIQFIVYDKPMSMKVLAEDMDIDINQAMYEPVSGLSYCTDSFYLAHENKVFTILHEFETKRMYGRLKRMEGKFPDYQMVHTIPKDVWELLELEYYQTKESKGSIPVGSFIDDGQDNFL